MSTAYPAAPAPASPTPVGPPRRRGNVFHNLGTVIGFELRRTLTRRSFWLITLAVPLLMIGIFALTFLSSAAADRTASAGEAQRVAFTYSDASGLVDPTVAQAAGGTLAPDAAAARQAVVDGKADLFIAYPADPSADPIQVVGRDQGMTASTPYASIAKDVLVTSAKGKVADPRVASVLASPPQVQQSTYVDGHPARGFASVIIPGMFLVFFYLSIVMLGNQMLNITVEEKENRVTEMILTTIHPTALIVGKIIALCIAGVVQAIVLALPVLLAPTVLMNVLPMEELEPSPGGSPLPSFGEMIAAVDPAAAALAILLFVGSFLLFTGLLVSIGSIMPTAKDAGSVFGAIIITLFIPFYAMSMILAEPHGLVSSVLSFFPLTAPITVMVRNALGLLYPWEAALAVAIIFASAVALLALGVRLFRTGSLSYDQRLDIRKVFASKRVNA